VVNMVNGRGGVTGAALVAHPQIDLVSFTGGTQTARQISASAGEGLKPLSLELGGKSANIIFATADMDRALDGALVGIFSNNGQQCLAGSRILVQRTVLEGFVEAFVQRAQRLRIGSPLDPQTEIGPLAFQAHRQRVAAYVDVARADGAQLLCGGASSLVQAGFETLVEAGYQPEIAYYEVLHELKLIVDLFYEGGITRMLEFVSETAQYGDYVSGPRVIDASVKARMKDVLKDIQDGTFTKNWVAEYEAGLPNYNKLKQADLDHPIEQVGKALRAKMVWLADGAK